MVSRVYLSLMDERQEYNQRQAASARAATERAGVSLDVEYADNNAVQQIHQLFARINAAEADRPTAIVVQTIPAEGLERVARNAVAAGIGWILLNRRAAYIPELRQARPDLPIASVTPDQEEVGRIQGRQIAALAPAGGGVLYVQGPADSSSTLDRLRGAREVLQRASIEWKLLNGDWREESGALAISAWLRLTSSSHQKPAVLAAQNDAMAVGARRACLEHHPEWADVPVIGCDGLPDGGQRAVKRGEMAATVVIPPTAGAGVDLVIRWLTHHYAPPAEIVLAPHAFPPEGELSGRSR